MALAVQALEPEFESSEPTLEKKKQTDMAMCTSSPSPWDMLITSLAPGSVRLKGVNSSV